MPKKPPSEIRTSNLQAWSPPRHANHYATGALPGRNFAFHSLSLLWLQRAGFSTGCSCGKTIFRALFFFALLLWHSETPGFPKKQLFRLWKIVFSALFFETQRSPALQKNNFSGSKKCFFPHCAYETQRSSALQEKQFFRLYFFLHTNLMKFRQAWRCKKNNFSGSKKLFFFPRCSHETQTSPALQKTIFQALINIFSHASCQICQLHLVTSFKLAPTCADACNT